MKRPTGIPHTFLTVTSKEQQGAMSLGDGRFAVPTIDQYVVFIFKLLRHFSYKIYFKIDLETTSLNYSELIFTTPPSIWYLRG